MRNIDISGNDQTKARPKNRQSKYQIYQLHVWQLGLLMKLFGLKDWAVPPLQFCAYHIQSLSFWPIPLFICNFSQWIINSSAIPSMLESFDHKLYPFDHSCTSLFTLINFSERFYFILLEKDLIDSRKDKIQNPLRFS